MANTDHNLPKMDRLWSRMAKNAQEWPIMALFGKNYT